MPASELSLDTLAQHYRTAIDAVCEIAETSYRLGKLDIALSALQAGMLLLDHAPEYTLLDESRTKLLLQHGKLLVTQGFYANSDYDEAVAVLLHVQEAATSAGDEAGIATALQLLGQVYYNKTLHTNEGRYEQVLDYLQQALALREALEDGRGVTESLFYSGLIYERWEQPDTARSYYTKALAIAQKHGYQIEQSYALRHLAGLAQDTGDLEQALSLFSQSLALREAAGYKILLPLSHLAVGDVFLAQRDLAQAATHYHAAYALSQEMDTPVAQVFCLLSLGTLYKEQRELAQARSYFEQAHASAKNVSLQFGLSAASKALEEIAGPENT